MKNPSSITRVALVVLLGAALSALAACHDSDSHNVLNPGGNTIPPGPSPVVEETRSVSGVTGVVLDGVGRLFVQQGGLDTLRIRTEEHIMPFIKAEKRGDLLVVGFQDGTSYNGEASAIEFHLTVVDLRSLELSGAGGINASNISGDRLSVVHSGIGSIDVSGLAVDRLDVRRTGIGQLTFAGTADRQSIVLGGQGNCDAQGLASSEADITILSTGSATVQVADRLDARIEGSGSVFYLGSPTVQRTGHGSGSVQPM